MYFFHATNTVNAGCTVAFLRDVFHGNIYYVRNAKSRLKMNPKLSSITTTHIGTESFYAGHHCSWCLDPAGIRTKLLSAQKSDTPRWGNYPEKLKLDYISGLIQSGKWFDGSKPTFLTSINSTTNFAPAYILENIDRYKHWLYPEYNAQRAQSTLHEDEIKS